jgi:hypothetical protein
MRGSDSSPLTPACLQARLLPVLTKADKVRSSTPPPALLARTA